ncbi:unnamed protein product [Echinostoma caproni]|uniref:guanylate cyclase n=1 Tax=Echinostoma caproni TaxID=27848 RepID=A0A3P8F1Z3_9TREM|nr:unnamed protein product [Echinostoma caproni]
MIDHRYESSLGYLNEINERGDAQGNYTVVMAVPNPSTIASPPSECGAVAAFHRSSSWYDRHTPLLPASCRQMRSDRFHYPVDLGINGTGPNEMDPLWDAMSVFETPLLFQPIGYFYPRSSKTLATGDAPQHTHESFHDGTGSGVRSDRSKADLSPSDTRRATYDYTATLPLLSELSNRTKKYSFSLMKNVKMNWINNHPPLDEPKCGFDGGRCKTPPNRSLEIGFSVVAALLLILAVSGGFVYRNHKFELELERLLWKVDSRDIAFQISTDLHEMEKLSDVYGQNFGSLLRLQPPSTDGLMKQDRQTRSFGPGFAPTVGQANIELDPSEQLFAEQYQLFSTATKRRSLRNQYMQSTRVDRKPPSDLIKHSLNQPEIRECSSIPVHNKQLNVDQNAVRRPADGLRKSSGRHLLSTLLTRESFFHRRASDVTSTSNHTTRTSLKPHGSMKTFTSEPVDTTCNLSWTVPLVGSATVPGYFKRQLVAVHRINLRYAHINRDVKKSLKLLRDVTHKNLSSFIGACVELDRVCVLWEFAARGSLRDILQPGRPILKPMFLASLTFDIIRGLTFLHDSDLCYHGNLKSTNCVVDSRWVLKLTDFGLTAFRSGESFGHLSSDGYFSRLFGTPPELLRRMLALILSRQLSAMAHPQLLCLAEMLMSQGFIFTLNDGSLDSEGTLEENVGNSFVGVEPAVPFRQDSNMENQPITTTEFCLAERNQSGNVRFNEDFPCHGIANGNSRSHLSKPRCHYSLAEEGKSDCEPPPTPVLRARLQSLSSSIHVSQRGASRRMNDGAVAAHTHMSDQPKLSTIMIHPGATCNTDLVIAACSHASDREVGSHGYNANFVTPITYLSPPVITSCSAMGATQSRNRVRLPEVRDPIGSMRMADIYAFGIVLFELYLQNGPYEESRHTPQEIIRRVVVLNDQFGVPYRPKLSLLSREEKYLTDCIEACWSEEPMNRPSIKQIASRLQPMASDQHTNIMDHMMALMETYAQELEKLVTERTTELMQEKRLSEALLYQMLPVPVAEQLKRGKMVEPEAFDNVTIFFSDICGFTEWSSSASPFEVVNLLNELYTRFDAVSSSYDVYKVETIGDAYMVVSGLPKQNENHAGEIASMSLRLLEEIQHNFTLALRIGIHSGPCAAGVVGTRMPRYCLFGDTGDSASEARGVAGVGIALCAKAERSLLDWIPVSSRLCALRLNGSVRVNSYSIFCSNPL